MTGAEGGHLDRIARECAPDVLAEALQRARARAVDRLADLLTDAIVARACADSGSTPPPEEHRPPGEPGADDDGGSPVVLYAYGITHADLPLPVEVPGPAGPASIARVTEGDLGLLVSEARLEQLRVDEEDLTESGRLAVLARGHDAVLRAAAAAGPVLPLRFGTAVPDESAARRLLQQHAAAARAQLARIGTAREWGVRLVRRLDATPVPAGSRPAGRDGMSGTAYLAGRRRALEEQDRAEADAGRGVALVEEALRPHVRESLQRGGQPRSSLLLDLACLVAPEREDAFAAACAELRPALEEHRLDVEVSGPWPPYSFVALDGGVPDGP